MKNVLVIALLAVSVCRLPAQIVSLPFRESFDSVSAPKLPLGWTTSTNKNPGGDASTSASSPRSGSLPNCISISDARTNQFFVSPSVTISGKLADSIEFFERRTSTFTAGLIVELSVNDDSLFTIVTADTLFLNASNTGAYQRRVIGLPAFLSSSERFRIRWRVVGTPSGGATAVLRIDDISVSVKKQVDLALQSLISLPSFPNRYDSVSIDVTILNRGINGTYSGTLRLFDSINVITSLDFTSFIAGGDSIAVSLHYPHISAGRHPLTVVMTTEGDEDSSNNRLSILVTAGLRARTVLINEIMYAPPSGMPEWIELINNSTDAVPLAGLKISDAGSTKALLFPQEMNIPPYSYAVITTDTNSLKIHYENISLLFQAGFSALNNTGDAVVLYDLNNSVIDSLYYSSSWGGGSGISLERKDSALSSTNPTNWKSSSALLRATPGKINSVSQKEYDAAVSRISVIPPYPTAGMSGIAKAVVRNAGKKPLSSVIIDLYHDRNVDSLLDNNEMLDSRMIPSIDPGDSSVLQFDLSELRQGIMMIAVKIVSAVDDDTTNNVLFYPLSIGVAPRSIIISEIMYAPAGDMPEWIEGYNATSSPVNIAGWTVSDNGASRPPLNGSGALILPGTYFVMTSDTGQLKNIFSSVQYFVAAQIPSLNNTTPDAVVLRDHRGMTIDSVFYKPAWGGSGGQSLQRYDMLIPAADSSNWRSSIPTPGRENDIGRKNADLAVRRVDVSPVNNGKRLTVVLANEGRMVVRSAGVGLYDDPLRSGILHPDNMLIRRELPPILPGDSAVVSYDRFLTAGGNHHMIIHASFDTDERPENNTVRVTASYKFSPGTAVFNEILYEPSPGDAEFVELLNPTQDTVDLYGWSILDQPNSSGNRALIRLSDSSLFLPPGFFLLVASDSSIFKRFPSLHGKRIVINPVLSLSNSGEALALCDLTSATIDSVVYSPSWHLKNIGTSGRSLERIDPYGTSPDARNWSSSVAEAGSTPLSANSIHYRAPVTAAAIALSPNPFSPDRDGFEDFLSIHYSLPTHSAMIRVRIYDVKGRMVRLLASNELSSSSGSVIWNGEDDHGHGVRIGMYIILFEALDHFGGTTMVVKDVAVVAGKL